MKKLKLKRIQGQNIINFLNDRHYDFNILSIDSYWNDAHINFNKIASPCNSLEEFKQELEGLQVEEMVHSTYFNEYLDAFKYGELVKNLDTEDVVYFVSVENLTYSIFLNNENGEELESFTDLHKFEIDFITERIQKSINKQLENVNEMIDWVNEYNNFVDDFEDSSMFEIAEFIAKNKDFDYLHGLRITNIDDLYMNEEEQEEFDNLTKLVNKAREVLELKKELEKAAAKTNNSNKKLKI